MPLQQRQPYSALCRTTRYSSPWSLLHLRTQPPEQRSLLNLLSVLFLREIRCCLRSTISARSARWPRCSRLRDGKCRLQRLSCMLRQSGDDRRRRPSTQKPSHQRRSTDCISRLPSSLRVAFHAFLRPAAKRDARRQCVQRQATEVVRARSGHAEERGRDKPACSGLGDGDGLLARGQRSADGVCERT